MFALVARKGKHVRHPLLAMPGRYLQVTWLRLCIPQAGFGQNLILESSKIYQQVEEMKK